MGIACCDGVRASSHCACENLLSLASVELSENHRESRSSSCKACLRMAACCLKHFTFIHASLMRAHYGSD